MYVSLTNVYRFVLIISSDLNFDQNTKFMDTMRTGAISAAFSPDGNKLKVVAVGAEGRLVDFDSFFIPPSWTDAAVPGTMMNLGGLSTVWNEGSLHGEAHPKSTIAVCSCHLKRVSDDETVVSDVFRVFYQNKGESIVSRTYLKGAWSDGSLAPYLSTIDRLNTYLQYYFLAKTVVEGGIYVGTVMSAQIDNNRENVYLFL